MSKMPENAPTDERPAEIGGSKDTWRHDRGAAVREGSRFHTLALEIAFAVILPTLAGRWLDSRTGKEPWFMIAGLVLGAAAAFRSVQRTLGESRKALEDGETAAKKEPE